MERTMRWRAGPIRAGRVHRRNTGGRGLRAAAVAGAMVAVTMPGLSADGAVGGTRSIEVFPDTDMIGLAGYPRDTQVKVEVLRHGFVVGFATKWTDSLGGIVMNHAGGLAGDCFDSPTSPDLQPSDMIRTTVLEPGGAKDTSVVRGVWIDDMDFSGTTITASGHVAVEGPEAVDPDVDVLQLRIDKDTDWFGTGRSDLREEIGEDIDPETGAWTHVITATAADVAEAKVDGEASLESAAALGSELTIAEFGPQEPLLGCPPLATGPTAPRLLKADDSGKAGDYVTNKATDLTFSGLAGTGVAGDPGPGQTVTLWVDGVAGPVATVDAEGVYEFTGVNLPARAVPHTVRVVSPQGDARRLVTVDATAPRVRLRFFRPSPLHLAGAEQLRAVYAIGEGATLRASVEHLNPTFTARAFAKRTQRAAGTSEFSWDAKDPSGHDVQPGRYRMVLQATDEAGNVTVQHEAFRITR
jgi:hypothetical protein